MKALGNHIQFRQPNYKSEHVFSKDVPKAAAIKIAFEQASSEEKRLEEAAPILRQEVLAVHMQICHLYHGHLAQRISFQSKKAFLHFFLFSQKRCYLLRRIQLFAPKDINSLCHVICYNLTNGQWKTPKHLLLGMSLRHITGSSKLITFLDRLLELETAMCDSVKENDSNLESGAAKQAVITNSTATYKEEEQILVNYMPPINASVNEL